MNRQETREALIKLGVPEALLPCTDEHEDWVLNRVSLRGSGLSEADLVAVDLRLVELDAALLDGADLTDADLRGVGLAYVYFKGANLREADLSGADLGGADLTDADLYNADLTAVTGLTAGQLAKALNLEHASLDAGRFADAVAAGYKPKQEAEGA